MHRRRSSGVHCPTTEMVFCPDTFRSLLILEYCVQLLGPQHKEDMDLLEWVQSKAMKVIR